MYTDIKIIYKFDLTLNSAVENGYFLQSKDDVTVIHLDLAESNDTCEHPIQAGLSTSCLITYTYSHTHEHLPTTHTPKHLTF